MATLMQKLNDLLSALTLRDRLLAAAALLGGLFFLVNTLFLSDLAARRAEAQSGQSLIQTRLDTLRQQAVSAEQAGTGQALLAEKRREIATLESQLGVVGTLEKALSDAPLTVAMLIERALRTPNARVVVDSVKVRAPETLLESVSAPIYRHGIDLQVRGGYADLLRYLESLERDERIVWSGLQITATRYPELTLTVSLHTLSRSPKPTIS